MLEVATAPAELIAAWNAVVNCAAFAWPVRRRVHRVAAVGVARRQPDRRRMDRVVVRRDAAGDAGVPCGPERVGEDGLVESSSPIPQTLATPPPPQLSVPLQLPHWSVLPQPSLIAPQFLPWAAQVVGVQVPAPQTLGVPPPPQVWPEPQLPHDSVAPQPSLMLPQFLPWAAQVVGVQAARAADVGGASAAAGLARAAASARERCAAAIADGAAVLPLGRAGRRIARSGAADVGGAPAAAGLAGATAAAAQRAVTAIGDGAAVLSLRGAGCRGSAEAPPSGEPPLASSSTVP